MLVKIEQLLKKWFNQAQSIIANPAIGLAALQPFLIVIAITILSYETVDLFYKVINFSAMTESAAVKNTASSQFITDSAQRSPLQNYGIITERNLFLSTLKAISGKQLEGGFFGSGEEITAFDLKGTVAGGTSFGYVVIEERGKNKQRLYRLGDMIGSAKLVKISRNKAVILSEGREITLKIKETIENPLLLRYSTSDTNFTPGGMALSRREVNEKLSDLRTIMTQAVVRPFFEAGTQEGYIVSDIKPDSLYQQLGLQNGDIIIDVNNKRMQSADDVMQLVNLMQTGGSIALNIKRNGKNETINYSFY